MREQKCVPMLVWVVLLTTLISNLIGETILGFQISGLGWVITLVFALFVLLGKSGRPRFPIWIWMPWFVLAVGYLSVADAENAIQRTVMLFTPIAVGAAFSKLQIGVRTLSRIEAILDKFAAAFLVFILINSGLVFTGALPEVTGLAPQATTAAVLGTFFAAKYALGSKSAVIKWTLIAFVPVIALTRTGILATGLTLPLTFGPLAWWKRIVIVICAAIFGLLIFNTERVQNKMFYSGQGTIFDIRYDNPDFQTSGRGFIQEKMEKELEESPWFGYGANASEEFVSDYTEGLKHPHNDYLRLAFDYGYFGMFVFLACMVLQMLHALRAAHRTTGAARLFLIAGAGAFVPFAIFMKTDNIVLYAAFFGNLHFMLLGCGYAALSSSRSETNLGWAKV